MGRGSSGKGDGGEITAIRARNGDTIDITYAPLKTVSAVKGFDNATMRNSLTSWEDKRRNNKIEYAIHVDEMGNQVGGENRGGRNGVRHSFYQYNHGTAISHIHPREDGSGTIGGTFSAGDVNFLNGYHGYVIRAVAAEGTYTLVKGNGYKGSALLDDYKKAIHAAEQANIARMRNGMNSAESFNRQLVEMHDWLLANQKKYGYTYGLERRK